MIGLQKAMANSQARTRVIIKYIKIILLCSRRDSNPPEYPAALLDPRTCAQDVLRRIYAQIPTALTPVDRNARDTEIYQRYKRGELTAELARVHGLSVQRIRKIIRRMEDQG